MRADQMPKPFNPPHSAAAYDLQELLIHLTRYGTPSVSHLGNGWYSRIEMHVASKGTTFKVASDFGMETPYAAVSQCEERILETLKKLSPVEGKG